MKLTIPDNQSIRIINDGGWTVICMNDGGKATTMRFNRSEVFALAAALKELAPSKGE